MGIKPFLKWAGGKRWLTCREEFGVPEIPGRYFEPFLGGAAVYFHLHPKRAVLSDINLRLIETYRAIQLDWKAVWTALLRHQRNHSVEYYYLERVRRRRALHERAAQFLYLNRSCWNGLYRENLSGVFNVPKGTKDTIVFPDDDLCRVSKALQGAELYCRDFAKTIREAGPDDFIFVDPPYTTAHNFNGFVKYNQKIFGWEDQIRLRDVLLDAKHRGATILLTNAYHPSVLLLYKGLAEIQEISRYSVISGDKRARSITSEALLKL